MTARKPCRCGREKSLGKGKKLCDVCLPLWREARRRRGLDRLTAWGELNPERYREYRREFDKDHQHNIREHAANVKLEHGCMDCGYNAHSAALDFDHVRGDKMQNISRCQSMEALLIEIAKCDVVCANCHRVRTWNRRVSKELQRARS